MNPALTAHDTDERRADVESENPADASTDRRPPKKRHGNSRAVTAAMIIGVIVFMICLALIAFSDDGESTNGPSINTTALAARTEAASSTDASAPAEQVVEEEAIAESAAEATEPEAAAATANATDAVANSDSADPDTPDPDTPDADSADADSADADSAVTSGDSPATADATDTIIDDKASDDPADAETGATETTSAAEATAPTVHPDSPPDPPNPPSDLLYAILSDGKIFLRGEVPELAISNQLTSAVEQVLGAGNVINEYVIDPAVPFDPDAPSPVFVNDTVLFATGSAEIAPDFYPLLALTPILHAVQPTSIVTVTGHTDSDGSAQANLALSQARVDAVRDWIVAQGGDPDRIIAIGKGETEPLADNSTEEGRQTNRRVEFLVEGFDFTLG